MTGEAVALDGALFSSVHIHVPDAGDWQKDRQMYRHKQTDRHLLVVYMSVTVDVEFVHQDVHRTRA